MTDPVNTNALRTFALRNQASNIRADATEAEQDWLEVAESLEAAADEVDRLRAGIVHMVPDYTVPQFSRILRDRDRLRAVIADAPHDEECHWSTLMNYDELYSCTCWKAEAL